jgi:hypothetical protein
MASYIFHIKSLRCYIIGKYYDIIDVQVGLAVQVEIGISCDIIYRISHVILDVKCETHYPSVQAIKSGVALKAVPKLSKHLVVYMEGLLAVRPFRFSCQGCC